MECGGDLVACHWEQSHVYATFRCVPSKVIARKAGVVSPSNRCLTKGLGADVPEGSVVSLGQHPIHSSLAPAIPVSGIP